MKKIGTLRLYDTMLNFVENLLENERTNERGSLSFSNKFSTKFSIVSNKLYITIFLRKWQFLFKKFNLIFNVFFFFVWVYLKQKIYFNRPNNLEDLLQRICSKTERKALTLLSAVYKVSVSAKLLAGNNFNICLKLYC
jgi:hypothetical protein